MAFAKNVMGFPHGGFGLIHEPNQTKGKKTWEMRKSVSHFEQGLFEIWNDDEFRQEICMYVFEIELN